MNVLSLFDGISCGQIALERAKIKVDNYYASEIDKYCIQVTQYNYPGTIQLGNIKKYKSWNLPKIDLIMGGSPCQGFSSAGGQLGFDDERSKLLFKFVECLRYFNPKWFLLENVCMKKEWEQIITDLIGVEPIMIDSALISGQRRKRQYWSNIVNIKQPKDKCIELKHILESGSTDRYKSYCIDANYYKGGSIKNYLEKKRRQIVCRQSELRLMVKENEDMFRKLTPLECERLQTIPDNYTEYGFCNEKRRQVKISNTQRYKAIGNGWTVDVIVHILNHLKRGKTCK